MIFEIVEDDPVFLDSKELPIREFNGGPLDPGDRRAGFMFHRRSLRGDAPVLRGSLVKIFSHRPLVLSCLLGSANACLPFGRP